MPEGSSSAAPVITPGPSTERKRRTRPGLPAGGGGVAAGEAAVIDALRGGCRLGGRRARLDDQGPAALARCVGSAEGLRRLATRRLRREAVLADAGGAARPASSGLAAERSGRRVAEPARLPWLPKPGPPRARWAGTWPPPSAPQAARWTCLRASGSSRP